jgi:hypothetical protein
MFPFVWLILLAPFLYIATIIVLGLILYLFIAAARYHQTYRASVRPRWQPTSVDQLPITFRRKLGEWIRQLQGLEFLAVANVTSIDPQEQCTQGLLVNRAAGMRAVIYCHVYRGKYYQSVHFVSEFSDGTAVKTNNTGRPASKLVRRPHLHFVDMPNSTPLEQLYQRHLAHVAERAPREATFILPPEGEEVEYITKRHADARTITGPGHGFILDDTGEFYRPTWRKSFQVAVTRLPIIGKILLRARARRLNRNQST